LGMKQAPILAARIRTRQGWEPEFYITSPGVEVVLQERLALPEL
jgi:predicted peroxiredoxin